MPEISKSRKMVDIDVSETSGVDHPAHLQEGWVVMKSATEAEVDNLFGPTTKVNKEDTVEPEKEVLDAAAAELEKAAVTQAAFEALQKKYDALLATTKVNKAADEVVDVFKSAPAEVRELLTKQAEAIEKQRVENEATRVELAKERDARLDERAVSASKEMFKSLSFDHAVVAPALRRLEVADAAVAKAVVEVLKAAEGQLESAGIFAEIGKTAGDATNVTATGKAMEIAKSLREADPQLSESQAIARAYEANPKLYVDYLEGK